LVTAKLCFASSADSKSATAFEKVQGMYPHRIRLRGPWDYEPLGWSSPERHLLPPAGRMNLPCRWADGGLAGFRFSGRVRFRRRFGYPGRIDAHERVWLTFAGADARAAVALNGAALGRHEGEGAFEFEVTDLLLPRNELLVEVEGPAETAGLCGEVALEVRCTAYLRGVRLWAEAEGDGFRAHAAGEVVGAAERPLDLYLVVGRSTAAYTSVTAAGEGRPFHLVSDKLGGTEGPAQGAGPGGGADAKVDLVNGATVWYTIVRSLAPAGPGPDR
jgi:hypothetical protein